MNIVFLDAKTMGDVPNLNILDRYGDVTCYPTTHPNQTLERVREADIVISNKVQLDKNIIDQAKNLKLICIAATGTNNVDKEAARAKGIPVKNATDYASVSVAQITIALLLYFIHDIPYYDSYIKRSEYAKSDIFTHHGKNFWELNGKRFAIIGLGNIGSQVAKIAKAFGAEVVYYSASGKNTNQPYLHLGLEELIRTSDIISIHAPLNKYTANLIDYKCLQQAKETALLINVGRGGIVNEEDLAQALDEGLIAGACLDVFENEPIDEKNPLLKLKNKDNLVLTPHIAWASIEARTLLVKKIGQNIQEFQEKRQ